LTLIVKTEKLGSEYVKRKRHIPLVLYGTENKRKQRIFSILAEPSFSPIDFNLRSLVEKRGWGPSDRFRFWFVTESQEIENPLLEALVNREPHLLIRKIDVEEDSFCHCEISLSGNIKIYSNDDEYAKHFFSDVFTNTPPSFHKQKAWKTESKWIKDNTSITFFLGSLHGALGWISEQIPQEIRESLDEAQQAFEAERYRSSVVMCRRAIESAMKLAYKRFFKRESKTAKGRSLNLNQIIREFERKKPQVIPKHLINVLDYVRNIGNVPGAHPMPIPKYRFTRQDAEGALFNTRLFLSSYFSKIDKEIGRVYSLKIDIEKS